MTIEERAEQAAALKSGKHNCCQAVLAALLDQTGLDEAQALALASGFGAGMGTMEGSCGALIGAAMAAGLHMGGSAQRAARQMSQAFKEKCGSLTCRELKGVGTGRILCPCEDCVRNAVRIYGGVMGLE